jgi:signal transduction histidine kinase
MTRLPIRWRLTAAFAGALAAVLTALGLFLYLRLGAQLDRAIGQGLQVRAAELGGILGDGEPTWELRSPPALEAEENLAQVLRLDGTVVASSGYAGVRLLSAGQLESAARGPIIVDRPGDSALDEDVRLLVTPVPAGAPSYLLIVGASLDEKQALSALLALEVVGLGAALLAASGAGYLVSGLALRPVEALRHRADSISGELVLGTGAVLPVPPVPDEIGRLAVTLNALLDRIRTAQAGERAALDRERRFIADASHQLRTPLAILRSEVDVALLSEADQDGLRAALRSVGEEADRLATLTGHLLLLTAAEERRLVAGQLAEVPVRQLLEDVADRFEARAAAAGRQLVTRAGTGLAVAGDQVRLEQALSNLVDNALRHGEGTVELIGRRTGGEIELEVRDGGPGIDPALRDQAFERFGRAASDGTGLGLAVVQAIATAHRGRAVITEDGHVVLVLPAPELSASVAGRRRPGAAEP